MSRLLNLAATLLLIVAVSSCVSVNAPYAPCDDGTVRISFDFEGASDSSCMRMGERAFRVSIAPETRPINPSPWYAFDIVAETEGPVEVLMTYEESRHRYHPKTSVGDGLWNSLAEGRVELSEEGRSALVRVQLDGPRMRLAAQELLAPDERLRLVEDFADEAGFDLETIGQTTQGRPVLALTGGSDAPLAPLVVILGGQHPPEVPGTLGLYAFLDQLLIENRDSETLNRLSFLIVPELNLDGIAQGHWRTNAGLKDLNRDWGPFEQPETRAVRNTLSDLIDAGARPVLLLDFHATRKSVLYTPPDDARLFPENFSRKWFEAYAGDDALIPERQPGHNADLPTAKSWFAMQFNAPGITVEFADDINRGDLDHIARSLADSLIEPLAEIK